jgi:hypothetical protein
MKIRLYCIDSLSLENQRLQLKLNDMKHIWVTSTIQRIDSPREICIIFIKYKISLFYLFCFLLNNVATQNINHECEEQIRQFRTDFAAASAQCVQL